jgi:hypothetical protein
MTIPTPADEYRPLWGSAALTSTFPFIAPIPFLLLISPGFLAPDHTVLRVSSYLSVPHPSEPKIHLRIQMYGKLVNFDFPLFSGAYLPLSAWALTFHLRLVVVARCASRGAIEPRRPMWRYRGVLYQEFGEW